MKARKRLAMLLCVAIFFSCGNSTEPTYQVEATPDDGAVLITWANPPLAFGLDIYYGEKGSELILFSGKKNSKGTVITGLKNGVEYIVELRFLDISRKVIGTKQVEVVPAEKVLSPGEKVASMIDELPEYASLTLNDKNKLIVVRNSYEDLISIEKEKVNNYSFLVLLEERIKSLEESLTDEEIALAFIDRINQLPGRYEILAEHLPLVNSCFAEYESFSPSRKGLISNRQVLFDLISYFDQEQHIVNVLNIRIAVIADLEEITLEQGAEILSIRKAYDGYSDDYKLMVVRFDEFLLAESEYVDLRIANLPDAVDLLLEDKLEVEKVAKLFHGLDPYYRGFLSNKEKFESIEARKNQLVALDSNIENFIASDKSSTEYIDLSWDGVEFAEGYIVYHNFATDPTADESTYSGFSEDLQKYEFGDSEFTYRIGSAEEKAPIVNNYFWIRCFVEFNGVREFGQLAGPVIGLRDLTDEEWIREINYSIYVAFSTQVPVYENEDTSPKHKSLIPLHKPGSSWSDNSTSKTDSFGGRIQGFNCYWSKNYARGYIFENIKPRYLTITGYMADLISNEDGGARNVRITASSPLANSSEFISIGGVYPGEIRYHMHINTSYVDSPGGAPVWYGADDSVNGVCTHSCGKDNYGDYLWERKAVPGFTWTHIDTPYRVKRNGSVARGVTNTRMMWDFYPGL
ncbi:MAG: hypothetical protein JXR63_13220 [Spirochaetales bacterium]|nr:hypothetical protein [Spirochaetales bacterium]